jgi:hypothetical protein
LITSIKVTAPTITTPEDKRRSPINFEDSIKNTYNNNAISLFIYDYANTVANKNCFLNSNFVNASSNAVIAMIVAKVPTT